MQNKVAMVQETLSPAGQKDLLRPLLTTLGNFEVSGLWSRHSGPQFYGSMLLFERVFDSCNDFLRDKLLGAGGWLTKIRSRAGILEGRA